MFHGEGRNACFNPAKRHAEFDRLSFNPTQKHSEFERWVCIYPAYINGKKTKAEGRLLSKDKCVDNPTYEEMCEVLAAKNMKFVLQNKLYCREKSKEVLYRGRIKVQLKNDDGTPLNADYPTRESIMVMLGEMIPKLKTRAGKQSSSDQYQQRNSGNAKKDKGKGKRR